jgi:hypothetical protein
MSGSEKIVFRCEHCQARFEVGSHLIGKQFRCDKCEKAVTVPEASTLIEEPVVAPESRTSRKSGQARVSGLKKASGLKPSSLALAEQERPASSAGTPEEGSGKKKRKRRLKLRKPESLTLPITLTVLVLFLFIGLAIFLGQNPASQAHPQNPPSSSENPEELPSDPSESPEDYAKRLIATKKQKFETKIFSYQDMKKEYETLQKTLKGTPHAEEIQGILDTLLEAHDQKAEQVFQETQKEAQLFLAKIQALEDSTAIRMGFIDLKNLWASRFPEGFEDTRFWGRYQEELATIQELEKEYQTGLSGSSLSLEEQAKKRFLFLQKQSDSYEFQNNIEEAKRLWETFPQRFQETSSWEKRNQILARLQALLDKNEYLDPKPVSSATETTPRSENTPPSEETPPSSGEPEEKTPLPVTPAYKPLNLSSFHGKVELKEGTYTFEYSLSKEEELQDFICVGGGYDINKNKMLQGTGLFYLQEAMFTEFEMTLEFYRKEEAFEAGILFGIRNPKNYFGLMMDTALLSLSLAEYEEESPYSLDQSVALFQYIKPSGKNVISILSKKGTTEIQVNNKVVFEYEDLVPPGMIGFWAKSSVQFSKLKIIGKVANDA